MSATSYGFGTGDLTPGPNASFRRDAEGKWVGTCEFYAIRDAWDAGLADRFQKGDSITLLFPEVGAFWSFMELEEWEPVYEPGGVLHVFATYVGAKPGDDETTYTLSGTLAERSILLHPLYIKDMRVNEADRSNMVVAYNGGYAIDPIQTISSTEVHCYNVNDRGKADWDITDPASIKWARVLLQQGKRTYKAPTLLWTVEKTSSLDVEEGLASVDISYLGRTEYKGRRDRPPGNPPMPQDSYYEWRKISISDVRTESTSANAQTWEMSPPGGFHRFPGEEDKHEGGEGLYNYDLTDLDGE